MRMVTSLEAAYPLPADQPLVICRSVRRRVSRNGAR
jgi:hypothetical protein